MNTKSVADGIPLRNSCNCDWNYGWKTAQIQSEVTGQECRSKSSQTATIKENRRAPTRATERKTERKTDTERDRDRQREKSQKATGKQNSRLAANQIDAADAASTLFF